MQSNNSNFLYEMTQMLNNKQNMQEDMSLAMEAFSNVFKEKYLNRINQAMLKSHNDVRSNPTKEICLLEALKPFAATSETVSSIERSIELFTTMNVLKKMGFAKHSKTPEENLSQNYYSASSINDNDVKASSVHSDGIYDVDENCITSKDNRGVQKGSNFSNIMLMFALMNGFRR